MKGASSPDLLAAIEISSPLALPDIPVALGLPLTAKVNFNMHVF